MLSVTIMLAMVSLTALCIFLIVAIKRLMEIVERVSKDVEDVMSRSVPTLENLETITSKFKSVAESLDGQVSALSDSAGMIREMAENVLQLERKLQERIEGPILETVAYVGAVVKGVRTFFDRVRP